MCTVDIEIHDRGEEKICINEWTCCLDCGLLMTRQKKGENKDWGVCPICTQVYKVGGEHPWIAKMLIQHINGVPPKKKHASLFRCAHCQHHYITVGANKRGGPVCYWCKINGYSKAKTHAHNRCLICNQSMKKRHLATGICHSCLRGIDKVKESLEYVYYIFGRARASRR